MALSSTPFVSLTFALFPFYSPFSFLFFLTSSSSLSGAQTFFQSWLSCEPYPSSFLPLISCARSPFLSSSLLSPLFLPLPFFFFRVVLIMHVFSLLCIFYRPFLPSLSLCLPPSLSSSLTPLPPFPVALRALPLIFLVFLHSRFLFRNSRLPTCSLPPPRPFPNPRSRVAYSSYPIHSPTPPSFFLSPSFSFTSALA